GVGGAASNGGGRTALATAEPLLQVGKDQVGAVSILLGNGDGTFQALPPIPVAGSPSALAAGDFTGNGRVDLAVLDRALSDGRGGVTILLSNGDGTFRALRTLSFGEASNAPFPDAI